MSNGVLLRRRFGEQAQSALDELGMTTYALAAHCALPVSRVERILCGRLPRITLQDMALIASALGAPLHGLIAPTDGTAVVEALQVVEQG